MPFAFDSLRFNACRIRFLILIAATFLCFPVLSDHASAQSHFVDCLTLTGNNATIVIPSSAVVLFGNRTVAVGDEIAVFDGEGRCAGAVRWTGNNVALTVWGADELTTDPGGLTLGDPMHFRLWSASDEQEWGNAGNVTLTFSDHKPYLTTENVYAPDRIYVIDSLHFKQDKQASR